MGALAVDSMWTMEDDFRLRKAAETGVSLESLARGDVKFSKQFTFQQLQDRWLAILYDPVVSAESSARMLELEHADSEPVIKTNCLGNIGENIIPICRKRKPESIRKRYYAEKKMARDHLSDVPPAADLCVPLEINDRVDLLTYEPAPDVDISNLEGNQCYNGDDEQNEESDGFDEILELLEAKGPELLPPIIEDLPTVNPGGAELANQNTEITNNANSYLIKDLFDLSMEEEDLPFMDADGNLIDMSYIDDLSSRWLDSPKNSNNNCKEFLDENNKSWQECGAQEAIPMGGSLVTSCKSPLMSVIVCTLNTEDPEIPTNDDVFLLNLVPSTSQEMQMDVFKPPQLTSKSRVQKPLIPKSNPYEQTRISSPIIGSQFRSEVHGDQNQSQACAPVISRSSLFQASERAILKSEQETHDFNSQRTVSENKMGDSDIVNNICQLNPVTEEAISSHSDNECDYDIPNFSDVEAMILDEDSSLDEQHLYLNRIGSSDLLQTFKYENADSQKRIMRLEQAAEAFSKRDMNLHGAFAILQGWHVKYYIKKQEVLLGRATEEFNVDIDLGREGQNSRVSRRQAIIHMDHEGLFHLKNLSKYSIFINCKELATNQSITLTSSCLIEIKGMGFLFETNERFIKQYVDSMKKQNCCGG